MYMPLVVNLNPRDQVDIQLQVGRHVVALGRVIRFRTVFQAVIAPIRVPFLIQFFFQEFGCTGIFIELSAIFIFQPEHKAAYLSVSRYRLPYCHNGTDPARSDTRLNSSMVLFSCTVTWSVEFPIKSPNLFS